MKHFFLSVIRFARFILDDMSYFLLALEVQLDYENARTTRLEIPLNLARKEKGEGSMVVLQPSGESTARPTD